MKYMGSKNRHAKEILPIILKNRNINQYYVEPFCGGCNLIDKVNGHRIANDSHYYLIELLRHVQAGGRLPYHITNDEYNHIRQNMHMYDPYIVGFVGFCLSFGSKWFGGYARGKNNKGEYRNYAAESVRNLKIQAEKLIGIEFFNTEFYDLDIPDRSIVYCDPPYKDTTKYHSYFDHDLFFEWCRSKTKEGHSVYVSEYAAPSDFIEVWSKGTIANFSLQNDIDKNRVEKLFIHESQS